MIPIVTEARQLARPPAPDEVDQRVYLHGVSWAEYEALLAMRGESSVPRITYLEGEVELMSPSRSHEVLKKRLARLVEAWAEESGIDLEGIGSWTLKESREERGAEPDECYVVGGHDDFERPDFAIEVVWTSGGISKLEVYRRLGVREVWFFEDGALTFHALRGDRYERIPRSEVLPSFDLHLAASLLTAPTHFSVLRVFRSSSPSPL
jgi:Uma2 family endonuclease